MRDPQDGEDRARAHRDPEDLQREADAIRADLDRTLEALEDKLSPRRIANRSVDLFRRNGTNILHKAGEAAAKHPIPVLLASAGLIWLASSKRKTRSARASQSASDTMRAAGKLARKTTSATQTRLGRVIRDRPVLCGTVAAALGAAVSAAVPATSYELDAAARARTSAGPLLQRAAHVLQRFATSGK